MKTENHTDHEKQITDLSCHIQKELFISGSIDGLVKIWNLKKELIREIQFPEPVYSVSFLNEEGDIIVGHLGKVSTVAYHDYKPYEVLKLYQPPQEELDEFYSTKAIKVDKPVF